MSPTSPRTSKGGSVSKLRAFSLRNNFRALYVRDDHRDPALDGLRAISIMLVILFHAVSIPARFNTLGVQNYVESLPAYWHWMVRGDKGVDLFFVLSGFLIGGALLGEKQRTGSINLGQFYFRRLLRLFPAYAVLLLILLAAPTKQDKIYLLANFFYVNNFLDFKNMIAPWTWSLAVEEQFYLLLPLFLMVLFWSSMQKSRLLLWAVVAAVAIRSALLVSHPEFFLRPYPEIIADSEYMEIIYGNLYTRFDALLLGVWVAHIQQAHAAELRNWLSSQPMRASLLVIMALSLLLFVMGVPIASMHQDWHPAALFLFHATNNTLFAFAIALLLICLQNDFGPGASLRKMLSLRIWLPLAQLAYSIYLFHEIFLLLAFTFIKTTLNNGSNVFGIEHVWLLALATLLTSTLFAALVFVFIEKPPMNMRKQLWLSLTTSTSKPSPA